MTDTSGRSLCPYCSVGCQVEVTIRDQAVISLRGAADSPVSRGLLCPKGALLSQALDAPGRLFSPRLRAARHAPWRDVGWAEAIQEAAGRLRAIIDRDGPGAVALYGSGQLDTEAWYLGNKLFKGHIGSNNVDSNSRLCMASAATAYRFSLGSDGPPTCWDDLHHADQVLVIGSNMAEAHPVAFQQFVARRRAGERAGLIVVDPRATPTARKADLHVPLRPGSDIAFCNAIGRLILDRNAHNRPFIAAHTSGFDQYADLLWSLDPEEQARICGVDIALLEEVALRLGQAGALLSCYCQGLGQSSVGTWKHTALINLHLLLGQIGRPGAGPFSLTGQPNAMGGRELGGMAHLLPGYRLIENAEHRREVAAHWQLAPERISPRPGLTAVEMFEALDAGDLKAIWIVCNNPLVSMPDLGMARRALARAELVIVQDIFENETTAAADVVFSAAGWLEKTGTMTTGDRHVIRSPQLVEPPGLAQPDWWIFDQMAMQLGRPGFGYADHTAIWDEYRALTTGRLCDQSGVTNERLEREAIQWPCPTPTHPGTQRLYTDLRFSTPDGRARFVPQWHHEPHEGVSADYPLVLNTGRIAAQWHTMTRTGKIAKLNQQIGAPWIEMHPDDAAQRGLSDGDAAIVRSARGAVRVTIRISASTRPGSVFMPFHWGALSADSGAVNELTAAIRDPISGQPELKHCAVQVEGA